MIHMMQNFSSITSSLCAPFAYTFQAVMKTVIYNEDSSTFSLIKFFFVGSVQER